MTIRITDGMLERMCANLEWFASSFPPFSNHALSYWRNTARGFLESALAYADEQPHQTHPHSSPSSDEQALEIAQLRKMVKARNDQIKNMASDIWAWRQLPDSAKVTEQTREIVRLQDIIKDRDMRNADLQLRLNQETLSHGETKRELVKQNDLCHSIDAERVKEISELEAIIQRLVDRAIDGVHRAPDEQKEVDRLTKAIDSKNAVIRQLEHGLREIGDMATQLGEGTV